MVPLSQRFWAKRITAVIAIVYSLYKKSFTLKISLNKIKIVWKSIFKVGLAPFGLSLTPNISLVLINRFSADYGGESAIATYACISYIICIVYLILQGVGDGSQPLMSKYYGERNFNELHKVNKSAYSFAMLLSLVGVILLFFSKGQIGGLFGSSEEVNRNISNILPVFLVSVPFVAISRIATASFYATEQTVLSYVLTFVEPGFNVFTDAYSSTFVWRTSYDMVEYGLCKNNYGGYCNSVKFVVRQAEKFKTKIKE